MDFDALVEQTYLSKQQVADYLEVSLKTVNRWIKFNNAPGAAWRALEYVVGRWRH
jgi:DNA-binding transcriptional regulator YiaG